MIRKIFLFLLLVGFIALSTFFFYKFNEKKVINNNSYIAIPSQSIWVMEVREAGSLFSTLKGTNIIYDELNQNNIGTAWSKSFNTLDSLVNENKIKYQAYQNSSVLIALVPSGVKSSDLLFSIQLPKDVDQGQFFNDIFQPIVGGKEKNKKVYDGANLQTFENSGELFYVSFYNDIALLSKSQMAVEDGIRQINSGASLSDEPNFKKVMQTAGSSRKINWYIHQKTYAKYLASFVDKHHNFSLENSIGLPEWTELDLWLKPNSLMFNGYGYSGNNKKNFTEVFKDQLPGNNAVSEILPLNTAFFINYSISNYAQFSASYHDYLKANNRYSSFEKRQIALNDSAKMQTDSILLKNIGSEICLAVLEIQNDIDGESVSSIYDKTLSIIRLKNPDLWLDDVVSLVKVNETDDLFKSKYREIAIYEMDVKGFVSNNLGGVFEGMENRFFVVLDDYVVFGEKLASLRELINAWKGDKVLSEDDHFESFGENMASTSNITVFTSPARSPYLLSYFLNKNEQNWLKDKVELFRKFEGLAIQITREDNGLDYYSVFLKHNPIYKKVTSSLWEIPLDTSVVNAPQLFENHYTKAGEILVQDVSNKLYLISNTGRILWTKQLDGTALSSFYKVDKYKNDKFQILFNTVNKIYLIDRNGKDVSGFPIKLKEEASAPLSLMDYERNRKYRLLQPLKNGAIACYNIRGEVVKGWKYSGEKISNRGMEYLQIKGKDYINVFYKDGSVKALNRKGQNRIEFKEPFLLAKNTKVCTQIGEDLKSSYMIATDSSGNIMRLALNDKLELMQFGQFSAQHYFTMADLDGDNISEFVIQDKELFVAFSLAGDQVLKMEEDISASFSPGIFTSEINNYLALGAKNSGNIGLYNYYGEKVDGNPFLGSSKPIIWDINLDGRLELVSTGASGMVYCYVLN